MNKCIQAMSLFASGDGTTGVQHCMTPVGDVTMKTWSAQRVRKGANYLQVRQRTKQLPAPSGFVAR